MQLPRRSLAAAVAAAALLGACSEVARTPVAPPDAAAPALSIYGIGGLRRAFPGEPCAGGKHREFDFWLGSWNVVGPLGRTLGTNVVRSELDGCVVSESWTDTNGNRGRSINAYDGDTGLWHQTWVAAGGGHLRLAGSFTGARMEMEGRRVLASNGSVIRDFWSWTPQGADTMVQRGSLTLDDVPQGSFTGIYLRAASVTPAPERINPVCTTVPPSARQLDFWVGSWAVEGENGLPLGTSTVALDLSGCLVEERFATPHGYRSVSFAYRDFFTGKWYRTLIDGEGERVELEGGPVPGGAIVMTGTEKEPGIGEFGVRVTLAPDGPDRVRQTWETSRNGGATWTVDLVTIYVRR